MKKEFLDKRTHFQLTNTLLKLRNLLLDKFPDNNKKKVYVQKIVDYVAHYLVTMYYKLFHQSTK